MEYAGIKATRYVFSVRHYLKLYPRFHLILYLRFYLILYLSFNPKFHVLSALTGLIKQTRRTVNSLKKIVKWWFLNPAHRPHLPSELSLGIGKWFQIHFADLPKDDPNKLKWVTIARWKDGGDELGPVNSWVIPITQGSFWNFFERDSNCPDYEFEGMTLDL